MYRKRLRLPDLPRILHAASSTVISVREQVYIIQDEFASLLIDNLFCKCG